MLQKQRCSNCAMDYKHSDDDVVICACDKVACDMDCKHSDDDVVMLEWSSSPLQ